MTSRLFVAIVPPITVLEDLAEFLEPRRIATTADDLLRWTPDASWHITLAFMPAVADRTRDELSERLTAAARKRHALSLQLADSGAFPNPIQAQVVWQGLRGDLDELQRLSVGTRNAAAVAGVEVDGAAFRPHLTLARTRRATDVGKWLQVLSTYSGPAWRADDVELIESQLGAGRNGRARYRTLETFALNP